MKLLLKTGTEGCKEVPDLGAACKIQESGDAGIESNKTIDRGDLFKTGY